MIRIQKFLITFYKLLYDYPYIYTCTAFCEKCPDSIQLSQLRINKYKAIFTVHPYIFFYLTINNSPGKSFFNEYKKIKITFHII